MSGDSDPRLDDEERDQQHAGDGEQAERLRGRQPTSFPFTIA